MRRRKVKDIARIFEEGMAIDEAVRRTARKVIEQHRRAGLPLVVYRDGKIARVPGEELEAELTGNDESRGKGT